MTIDRRGVLAAAPLLLAACRGSGTAAPIAVYDPKPLKSIAPCRVGCCVQTPHLQEPAFTELLLRHFSQITPEWQMKMEYILPRGASATDPSTWRWDAPDAIAGFAKANGLGLYGTTLAWYAEKPPAFEALDGQKGFEAAYRNYMRTVVTRYRGAVGWDVVNEAVEEDGSRLREHLWSKNLGQDEHMIIAYEEAHAADPKAVLFLNEYFLEKIPRKRLEYMRLAERLLKKGAKLSGLGIQSHLDIDARPGASKAAIADVASLGLPVFISELDIGLSRKRLETRPRPEQLQLQARVATEVAEAFLALPARQRFAFGVWGLRDKDSWMRNPPNAGDGTDQPLLFDDDGRPKPMFEAVANAFAKANGSASTQT